MGAVTAILTMLPESQAKLMANAYIGEMGRKYSCKDYGFTCSSLDTAQYIWASALSENRDVTTGSYQNPMTKNELYLISECQIERILSDNTSINRFVISQAILKCLIMMKDNVTKDSAVYSVNTDGIFITNPKHQYPDKKGVEFDVDQIGKVLETYSSAVYFEKHCRETLILIITLIMCHRPVESITGALVVVKHTNSVKW